MFDHVHELYRELRTSTDGRAALAGLMRHRVEGVRLLAATHSLAYYPEEALSTLEELQDGPGLYAVSAEYTIRSFRSGTLNLDF